MNTNNIKDHLYAVIMAGGGGERFWPKSRQAHPKQLLNIFGNRTMIQATAERISDMVPPDRLLVITNKVQAPLIREQLPGVPEASIIAEPFGRDTAPCIALGAAMIMERDPEGIMIVLPADHVIKDSKKLNETLWDACRVAWERRCLVTLGIAPTGPSTGYGYIRGGEQIEGAGNTKFSLVKEFMEKPDRETARRYIDSGEYFWNSGMFVWRASTIVDELRKQIPEIYEGYSKIKKAIGTDDRDTVIRDVYSCLEKKSIDYGIMENAGNVVVAEATFDWDDAGSWLAIERHHPSDSNGNVILGEAVALNTDNCIIVSEDGIVGCVGIKDLIVVKTPDAVLVCPRDRAQDVKKIVRELKASEEWKKYT